MEAKPKRITLDFDSEMERRLTTTAALKGMSVPQYCHVAIGRELDNDEACGVTPLPFGHEALDRLDLLRKAATGGERLQGDSVDFIREARMSRTPD